jgi:hypothetical protein
MFRERRAAPPSYLIIPLITLETKKTPETAEKEWRFLE